MIHRAWLAAFGAIAFAGALAFALVQHDGAVEPVRPPAERPTLALLTSLPLMFGESFGLDSGGSPALTRIERSYNVQPIGVADGASLAGKRLLLMAHPRAQPATALVELDQWVRGGGRVLLLADPRLSWPSERTLGDKLRPPPAFADTGLLGHWGLTLSGPVADGPSEVKVGEMMIVTATRGTLTSKGSCEIVGDGLVARCRIGAGMATVIADADLLNDESISGPGGPAAINFDFVLGELARFERR